jgi:hypothetical protein
VSSRGPFWISHSRKKSRSQLSTSVRRDKYAVSSFFTPYLVKPKALPRAPETQGVRTRRNSGNQAVLEAVPEDRPLPEGSNAKEEPALAESKEGAVTKSKAVMPRRPILPDLQVPAFQPGASRQVRHHADTHRPLIVGFGSSLKPIKSSRGHPIVVPHSWHHPLEIWFGRPREEKLYSLRPPPIPRRPRGGARPL